MMSVMHPCRQLLNLFVLSLLLLPAHGVSAATISVKADRDPVIINESFQLIFEAAGAVDDEPDFSPLNQDFEVLATSVSSNVSIINAKISRTKQWQLTVLARRVGRLPIPTIDFGSDRSQAGSITVARSPAATGNRQQGSDRKIFVEVEASELKPRVQSQVLYTVKLYRSVNISNASLSEPEASGGNAVIERLGEDQSYDTWIQGRRYIVLERNYAIYPQRSERLTLAPIRFQGQMVQDRFSMFDLFGSQAQTVIRQSEPITLEVQAIPAAFAGGHWLPSQNVVLMEEWSGDPLQLKTGEPITRTLILRAAGQTASQLPELPPWSLPDFKQYPDQAALIDDKTKTGITGSRQEKIAIIPSKPGQYTLPAIKLPWWNTEKNRLEYAELPQRQIMVLPAVGNASDTPDLAPAPITDLKLPAGITDKTDVADGQAGAGPETGQTAHSALWLYLSLVLGALWLMTLLLWWHRSRGSGIKKEEDTRASSGRHLSRAIRRACQQHDADKVKAHLLQWAQLRWADNPPMSLGEIGRRSSRPLADEIARLSDSLYSAGRQPWDGSAFWAAFEREPAEQKQALHGGRLEPLYKL